MKQKTKQSMVLICMVAALTLTSGCLGKSVVPLTYPAQLADTPWCRWDITIADFEDERPRQLLGAMDEENDYTAASDVAEWVTRSMAAELEARGCTCGYGAAGALPGDGAAPGFVVGGKVRSITLDKIGINQWSTRMEILVELKRAGELVFGQTYTGTVERTFLLGTDGPQEIMAEALSDILADAAIKLVEAMKKASR